MKRSLLFFVIAVLFSNLHGQAQNEKVKTGHAIRFGKKSTCDCDSLWKIPDTRNLVLLLEKATTGLEVWPGYNLKDATIILNAGKINNGDYCLGLWRKGKAVSFAQLKDSISMLTPIYSYYLNYTGMPRIPEEPYFQTAKNTPDFAAWMTKLNVSSAVYMPVTFSKLPFSVPAIVKVQLAIHEAFHVEVMLRYWYTGKGKWPKWDKQPNRKELQLCYTNNDPGRTSIRTELTLLADVIEALLDSKKERVCSLGKEYINTRNSRYLRLTDLSIQLADSTQKDCAAAESIMELEEGLADYGSWKILFDMGLASKEDLFSRYRANQNDHFYLSGCMLMHALTLMTDKSHRTIIDEIVHSSSVEKGSLFHAFKDELKKYCEK